MTDEYLHELGAQLGALGIRGGRRRRILTEAADHLRSDPGALSRFGDPREIARRFADELGAASARALSLRSFAVLALAGAVYATLLLVWSASGALRAIARSPDLTALQLCTAAVLVVAPQVSFAAGVMALIRALRFHGRGTLPAAEVRILRRRTIVALGFGVAAMAASLLFATESRSLLPAWTAPLAFAGAGTSIALLLATGITVLGSARVRVQTAGGAGDMFDDLGPAIPPLLRGRPWRFTLLVSGALAAVVFAAGVGASDGYDGALRGIAEAAACLAGFAVLGRFLGLRR